jgi:hypothetical protein
MERVLFAVCEKCGQKPCECNAGSKSDLSDGLATAIAELSVDMHQVSSRPCPTCRKMSKAIGRPFGCYAYRAKRGISTERFGG